MIPDRRRSPGLSCLWLLWPACADRAGPAQTWTGQPSAQAQGTSALYTGEETVEEQNILITKAPNKKPIRIN